MINQEDFFEKFNIDKDEFDSSGIDWKELIIIKDDFEANRHEFVNTLDSISKAFRECNNVHSVRSRVKNSEHLIEKLIRKKILNPGFVFSKDDYLHKITDYMGLRAIHLYKTDWESIHKFIKNRWNFIEEPVAYIREGDDGECIDLYKSAGCEIQNHKYGYRSVHYLVESALYKNKYVIEIQVRTIFEEGWSEIDHRARYPYDQDNPILTPYLKNFNVLAGLADSMGEYINRLISHSKEIDRKYKESIEEKEAIISQLIKKIDLLQIDQEDRDELMTKVAQLEKNEDNKIAEGKNNGVGLLLGLGALAFVLGSD